MSTNKCCDVLVTSVFSGISPLQIHLPTLGCMTRPPPTPSHSSCQQLEFELFTPNLHPNGHCSSVLILHRMLKPHPCHHTYTLLRSRKTLCMLTQWPTTVPDCKCVLSKSSGMLVIQKVLIYSTVTE